MQEWNQLQKRQNDSVFFQWEERKFSYWRFNLAFAICTSAHERDKERLFFMFVKLVFLSRFAMRRKSRKKFTVFVCLFVCEGSGMCVCVCYTVSDYWICICSSLPRSRRGCFWWNSENYCLSNKITNFFSTPIVSREEIYFSNFFFKEKSPGLDTFFKQNNKFECPFWVFNFVCLNY